MRLSEWIPHWSVPIRASQLPSQPSRTAIFVWIDNVSGRQKSRNPFYEPSPEQIPPIVLQLYKYVHQWSIVYCNISVCLFVHFKASNSSWNVAEKLAAYGTGRLICLSSRQNVDNWYNIQARTLDSCGASHVFCSLQLALSTSTNFNLERKPGNPAILAEFGGESNLSQNGQHCTA